MFHVTFTGYVIAIPWSHEKRQSGNVVKIGGHVISGMLCDSMRMVVSMFSNHVERDCIHVINSVFSHM